MGFDALNTCAIGSLKRRLTFIDLLRAYAILMMLQGHFTDTLLADAFRDPAHPVFAAWNYLRGMTAPIFFFASGLIFVFLLLKDDRPVGDNERVKKGIRRGLQLIAIGYVLRLCFPQLLTGHITPNLFRVDVLHCIGLALLSLIAVYALSRWARLPYALLLLLGAGLAFFFFFDVREANYNALPIALQNYFTKDHGSVFTPVPWIGFTLAGGVLGTVLHHRPKWAFGSYLPIALLITGLLIDQYSSNWLMTLHYWSGLERFKDHAYFNFLLLRLGHVLVVVSLFIWLAQAWRNVPSLLLKIGGETLAIYEVHYILLYSTWLGIGLSAFWAHSLTPVQTLIGAIAFLAFFVVLVAYLDRIRAVWHAQSQWLLRLSRIKLRRRYHRWAYR